MIDHAVFGTEIAILADRYGRELKAPTIAAFYDVLGDELSTDEFIIGCRRVMKREAFFPSPQAIIDAARPKDESPEQRAAEMFDRIRDRAVAWGRDPVARKAVANAGGESLVMADDPRIVSYARRDFIAAFVELEQRRGDEEEIARLMPTVERVRARHGLTSVAGTVEKLLASIPQTTADR